MILFHAENIKVPDFDQELFCSWLSDTINQEGGSVGDVQFVFCSDAYLLNMNISHLQHDYYTDIITFDYCENDEVNGDLFISIDRVIDNAKTFNVSVLTELRRVAVHGVLHLLGYKDKTDEDVLLMRAKEDFYLARYVSRGT